MRLIAGSKSEGGTLDCNHGGLREQEPAQPIAKGVQGEAGDGDAGAIDAVKYSHGALDVVSGWHYGWDGSFGAGGLFFMCFI